MTADEKRPSRSSGENLSTGAKGAYRPTPTRGAPVDNTSSDDVSERAGAYRTEFHRRVLADLAPAHADHAADGIRVEWYASSFSGCDTCGPETSVEVTVVGACGCGEKLRVTQEMSNHEYGLFMQRITS